jgi:hypothetical protein
MQVFVGQWPSTDKGKIQPLKLLPSLPLLTNQNISSRLILSVATVLYSIGMSVLQELMNNDALCIQKYHLPPHRQQFLENIFMVICGPTPLVLSSLSG